MLMIIISIYSSDTRGRTILYHMSSNNDNETTSSQAAAANAADDEKATATDMNIDAASLVIVKTKHLNWTKKQGRILSGGGIVESLPWKFEETELPHYHLLRNETHAFFEQLRTEKKEGVVAQVKNPVIGVWERPLFYGGYEQSTSKDEITYNIQTQNLFIDLRIPRTRSVVFKSLDLDTVETEPDTQNRSSRKIANLSDLTPEELCLYARQHVFGGYTECHLHNTSDSKNSSSTNNNNKHHHFSGTRRHAIDWNFVGIGRPRPNKWWIKFDDRKQPNNNKEKENGDIDVVVETWEEVGYVRDNDWSIPYYFERWERHLDGGPLPRLALRKSSLSSRKKRKAEVVGDGHATTTGAAGHVDSSSLAFNFTDDGIIVIVGDHFNYLLPRKLTPEIVRKKGEKYPLVTSLVDLVDAAVSQGDLDIARAYLSIEAGHGRVSNGWTVDCSITFWKEGTPFWDPRSSDSSSQVKVVKAENIGGRDDGDDDGDSDNWRGTASVKVEDLCKIMWKDEVWDIYDCSFETVDELQSYFSGC